MHKSVLWIRIRMRMDPYLITLYHILVLRIHIIFEWIQIRIRVPIFFMDTDTDLNYLIEIFLIQNSYLSKPSNVNFPSLISFLKVIRKEVLI